jgi:hypothetical protein
LERGSHASLGLLLAGLTGWPAEYSSFSHGELCLIEKLEILVCSWLEIESDRNQRNRRRKLSAIDVRKEGTRFGES